MADPSIVQTAAKVSTPATWSFLADIFNVVFLGSALATFVASVMSEEQQTRLKNGAFGVVAGSSVGALAGLFNNKPDLLAVGFLGSTVGGVLGWSVHLVLSMAAGTKWFRPLLEYQFGGFSSVRNRLLLDDQNLLLSALQKWRDNYTRMLARQKLTVNSFSDVHRTIVARHLIETWLVSFVDTYALVFGALVDRTQYRSRVTVILFGKDENGHPAGKHWLSYAGVLENHKTTKTFPAGSIGYRVLIEQLPTPYFTDSQAAKEHSRDEVSDRPFCTFRVDDSAIVALDWPSAMKEDDPYVRLAKETFHSDVCPAIAEVLKTWTGVASEVGLRPLTWQPEPAAVGSKAEIKIPL